MHPRCCGWPKGQGRRPADLNYSETTAAVSMPLHQASPQNNERQVLDEDESEDDES